MQIFTCFSTFLALLRQESFNFHWLFLFRCNISHMRIQTHTHTMVPAESVKFYRNSDLKQFLSAKLFFTYSKKNPPEFVYVRFFFLHIRKLQPKMKIYVCNRFGRNGNSRQRLQNRDLGPLIDPLEGPNRQSPIASVQRTRSTLAGHSAVPRGTNVTRTNANRAIRIAAERTQGL